MQFYKICYEMFAKSNHNINEYNHMTKQILPHETLLPELKLIKIMTDKGFGRVFLAAKNSTFEVCPKCAQRADTIYDRRIVEIKDAPLRNCQVLLKIIKRRFYCKYCIKPFTEPILGISKGHRTTERLKRFLFNACENYVDISKVALDFPVSRTSIYRYYYKQLYLERKKRLYPWPKKIGLDEHSFSRRKNNSESLEWVSVVVDHVNKRLMEVTAGRTVDDLTRDLSYINGRENVQHITIDMSETYRSFIYSFFPNAKITVDKFHLVRLFQKEINQARLELTGDKRRHPMRKFIFKSYNDLKLTDKIKLNEFLDSSKFLKELYFFREHLQRMYRSKSIFIARMSFNNLLSRLSSSTNAVCRRLSRTLLNWGEEILNYFHSGLTNARAEGFNNKAKLIKRRAYGYKSFKNYRLRLLNACA